MLNNGSAAIKAGSQVEWCFGDVVAKPGEARRILVQEQADASDDAYVIGRAMNFARKGQNFDLLIRQ